MKLRILTASLALTIFAFPAIVPNAHAQGCTFSEEFSGDLSAWTPFGSPASFIDSGAGNPSPSLQINGDASYPSGLNTQSTFTFATGLSIRFELMRSQPIGEFYSDGGVGYGLGGASDANDVLTAYITHRTDGKFEFWFREGTPQQAVYLTQFAITEARWIPCEIRIRSDGYVDYYIDNVRRWTSPTALGPQDDNGHVFVEGRRHYVDNVCVDELNLDPDYLCVFPPVTGCDLGDPFEDLSQWQLFGSPSSFIESAEGNPAPAVQINGDAAYPSGGNSLQTFDITGGMSIRFELKRSGPVGQFYTDGGVGYGVGGETDAADSLLAYLVHRTDGRFEFWFMEGTPQQAVFVTTYGVTESRWIPCEIRIDKDRYVHFLVDCQLLWSSPEPLPLDANQKHVFFEGRSHLVDNVCVDWFGPLPVETLSWGGLKARYSD